MIYIEDEQDRILRRKALEERKSIAQLIRDALEQYIKINRQEEDFLAFVGIGAGPKGDNASERVDEVLREALK